jgi:hypothetical protein
LAVYGTRNPVRSASHSDSPPNQSPASSSTVPLDHTATVAKDRHEAEEVHGVTGGDSQCRWLSPPRAARALDVSLERVRALVAAGQVEMRPRGFAPVRHPKVELRLESLEAALSGETIRPLGEPASSVGAASIAVEVRPSKQTDDERMAEDEDGRPRSVRED